MEKIDIKRTLSNIQPTTKAARLRGLLPEIELKLASGVQLKEIQAALQSGGLEFTLSTLKTYLYRFRKEGSHHPATVIAKVLATSPATPLPADIEHNAEDVTAAPVSPHDLARLMKPDAQQEAADIANYERIAKQQRKEKKPV